MPYYEEQVLAAVAAYLAGTPGASAAGPTKLGKAEDSTHASGDVGVMALGVRNDNGQVVLSGGGAYTPIATNSRGAIFIRALPATQATVTLPVLTAVTSGVVLAANPSRRGATIQNKTGAVLLLKCGTAASATSRSVELADGAIWEVPSNYAGIIHGFATLAPAANTILVTEYID